MQKIVSITGLLIIAALLLLNGCIKEEFDKPPVLIPKVDFPATLSILELKSAYSGTSVDLIGDTILIAGMPVANPVIQGIVVGNDESGNLYKTLIIQDHSGGIELKIDKTGLYNEYRLGQRIFIKCKGLYLGNYGTLVQLGYIYQGGIGRIPDIMIKDHLFRDSLPGLAPVPAITTIGGLSTNILSTLVRFDSVFFDDGDAGLEFAPQTADATNRNLFDKNGNVIIVRTSKYANFAASPIPAGIGSVVGVLSKFNNDWQLYIRDAKDLVNFKTDPNQNYILKNSFSSAPANWVMFSVASNKNWEHDAAEGFMKVNGYGGDAASDDWLITPALALTGSNNYFLSFDTWTRYSDSGIPAPLEAMISTDYVGSGNPLPATWTPLAATISPANSQAWTGSGDVSLNAFAGQTVYVAFRYQSSGTGSNSSSSWQLDNVKLWGTP